MAKKNKTDSATAVVDQDAAFDLGPDAPPDSGDDSTEAALNEFEAPDDPEADPEPAAKAGPEDEPDALPVADGYEVYEVSVAKLKLGTLRRPTDAAVDEMVQLIKANGLQNPIVVTDDGVVVDGGTRLLAYRKMKLKTIPAYIGFDAKTGNRLKVKQDEALVKFRGLAANLGKTDFTPHEIAAVVDGMMKAKNAESVKDLAARIGCSTDKLQRPLSVVSRGTKKLNAKIASGDISLKAAEKLVSNFETHAELDKEIDRLSKEGGGKVRYEAAEKSVQTKRRSGRHAKGGRPKQIVLLGEETLKTDETGITGSIKMTGKDEYTLRFECVIDCPNQATFKDFDLVKRVQQAMAKLDRKDVSADLEAARKSLND